MLSIVILPAVSTAMPAAPPRVRTSLLVMLVAPDWPLPPETEMPVAAYPDVLILSLAMVIAPVPDDALIAVAFESVVVRSVHRR